MNPEAVFLDTTYCNPKYTFPPQEQAVSYVANTIYNDMFNTSDDKMERGCQGSALYLVATYVIGKEKILKAVAARCECKIYVPRKKMGIVRRLELDQDTVHDVLDDDHDDGIEAATMSMKEESNHVDEENKAASGIERQHLCFTCNPRESQVHVVSWGTLGETFPYFRPNWNKLEELAVEHGVSRVVGFVPTGMAIQVLFVLFITTSR